VINRWVKNDITDVFVKAIEQHRDQRGFLCETFRLDELPSGLQPVMSYLSFTEPMVSRGPHEHFEQTDIFALVGPGTFLVKLWDNRPHSPTYGSLMELKAGEERRLLIVIPPGVVHGYKNISPDRQGMVINYPNRLYRGPGKKEAVDEIRYEDDPESPFKFD